MEVRQPKKAATPGTGRQRLLKPLASVHATSPLRLRVTIEDLEAPRRKVLSKPKDNPGSARKISVVHLDSSDSDDQSDHDKENTNPQLGPITATESQKRDRREPLGEIELGNTTGKLSGSEFQLIDTDDEYSLTDKCEIETVQHCAPASDPPSTGTEKGGSTWRTVKRHGEGLIALKNNAPRTCAVNELQVALEGLALGANNDNDFSSNDEINAISVPRPSTPTDESRVKPSPTKSRLNSPTKIRENLHLERKIPPTPHRPSLDAFWSQDLVNSWNDEHSPKKVVGSPRKGALQRMLDEVEGWSCSDEEPSPMRSLHTTDGGSVVVQNDSTGSTVPTKPQSRKAQAQQAREAKMAVKTAKADFLASREVTSTAFLHELDEKITAGKIAELTKETGGVKILWSVTLRSTAGRANWKREAYRASQNVSTGSIAERPPIQYRHVANIELATKVITTNERLLNVIAHEFCHLANFMISNVKDQPHGKSFKTWASKVSRAFKDRGVVVTTKHSWDVEYKYEWACMGRLEYSAGEGSRKLQDGLETMMNKLSIESGELHMDEDGCGTLYQRHSKSIDPTRHRCGKCKGKLVQIKPAPRRSKAQSISK